MGVSRSAWEPQALSCNMKKTHLQRCYWAVTLKLWTSNHLVATNCKAPFACCSAWPYFSNLWQKERIRRLAFSKTNYNYWHKSAASDSPAPCAQGAPSWGMGPKQGWRLRDCLQNPSEEEKNKRAVSVLTASQVYKLTQKDLPVLQTVLQCS